jgi:hypothetical protein
VDALRPQRPAPDCRSGASVAETATIGGAVTIGDGCFIDHRVVIERGGAEINLGSGVIVLAHELLLRVVTRVELRDGSEQGRVRTTQNPRFANDDERTVRDLTSRAWRVRRE